MRDKAEEATYSRPGNSRLRRTICGCALLLKMTFFILGKLTFNVGGGGRGNRLVGGGSGGKNCGDDDCLEGLHG